MDIEKNIMKNYTQRRLEEFDDEFNWLLSGSITTFDVLGFEQRLNVDMTRIDLKSFLSTSINQAIAEDRERVRGEIETFTVYYRSVYSQDCSRNETEEEKSIEMIKLSDINSLLSSLDKEIINPKESCSPNIKPECDCNGLYIEPFTGKHESYCSTKIHQAEQEILKRVRGVIQKERDTWAKESIGDKALQSLEKALQEKNIYFCEKCKKQSICDKPTVYRNCPCGADFSSLDETKHKQT